MTCLQHDYRAHSRPRADLCQGERRRTQEASEARNRQSGRSPKQPLSRHVPDGHLHARQREKLKLNRLRISACRCTRRAGNVNALLGAKLRAPVDFNYEGSRIVSASNYAQPQRNVGYENRLFTARAGQDYADIRRPVCLSWLQQQGPPVNDANQESWRGVPTGDAAGAGAHTEVRRSRRGDDLPAQLDCDIGRILAMARRDRDLILDQHIPRRRPICVSRRKDRRLYLPSDQEEEPRYGEGAEQAKRQLWLKKE